MLFTIYFMYVDVDVDDDDDHHQSRCIRLDRMVVADSHCDHAMLVHHFHALSCFIIIDKRSRSPLHQWLYSFSLGKHDVEPVHRLGRDTISFVKQTV